MAEKEDSTHIDNLCEQPIDYGLSAKKRKMAKVRQEYLTGMAGVMERLARLYRKEAEWAGEQQDMVDHLEACFQGIGICHKNIEAQSAAYSKEDAEQ